MIELTDNQKYELGCRIVTALHSELYGDDAMNATKEDVILLDEPSEQSLKYIKHQQERLRSQAMLLAETALKNLELMESGDYQNQFQECRSLLD